MKSKSRGNGDEACFVYVEVCESKEEMRSEGMQSVGCRGETGPAELLWRSK